ncbi:MAG: lasso peptide biosynthesis B2 protein [Lysobacterales bacterium]
MRVFLSDRAPPQPMPTPLQKWLALDRHEQATLLGLLVLLPLLRLGLWLVGFERMRALMTRAAPRRQRLPASADGSALDRAERLAEWVAIAGRRGPIRATCLPQALALYGLLGRRGHTPTIRFGVRRIADRVIAHAWVELDGIALANGDQGQSPLDRVG